MICVIVFSVFIIFFVVLFIIGILNDESGLFSFSLVGSIVCGLIVLTCLRVGRTVYKSDTDKLLAKKEAIELCLENKPSTFIIEEAETFNSNVDFGNNYWCRFSIEDRSEFKIDINSFLSKENINEK